MASLVRETDNYGATHDDERVVPLATMDPNNRTNSNTHHPTGNPSWNTKEKLMCAGIIGMTAAVASSALLFFSILDFSKQASTEPSFLLRDSGPYSNCLPASGSWPGFNNVRNDDGGDNGPYVTCFYNKNSVLYAPVSYCWSRSYKNWAGDWKPCTPQGFGENWVDAAYFNTDTGCGTPCPKFSSGLDDDDEVNDDDD